MKNIYLVFNWKKWPLLPIFGKGIDWGTDKYIGIKWLFLNLKLVYRGDKEDFYLDEEVVLD